jgi:hypothetical protein
MEYIKFMVERLNSLNKTFVKQIIQDYTLKGLVNSTLFNYLVVARDFKSSLTDVSVNKALDGFSESYARVIINPVNKVHEILKREINRHITTVVYEQDLSFALAKLFEIDNPDQADEQKRKNAP